jgi:hypothetical protein
MSLIPLTTAREVEHAFRIFAERMKRGQPLPRTVGWQGGNQTLTVCWHIREKIWTSLELGGNRHWCGFGTTDPNAADNLVITVEFNPPYEGVNRRCAGVFARDDAGNIYATHSGKVGGGRSGVGRLTFLPFYRGDNRDILLWPDGQETDVIVIGRIDGKNLVAQFAHFAREVERFKASAVKGARSAIAAPKKRFTPEFVGQRKSYRYSGKVESQCNHGLVVSALADSLEKRGLEYANDQVRDLFVVGPDGISVLFEIKTEVSTSSVYQAVGQLMLNGAAEAKAPKLVLVLPEKPQSQTRKALEKLGIVVLPYAWHEAFPVFHDLDNALA